MLMKKVVLGSSEVNTCCPLTSACWSLLEAQKIPGVFSVCAVLYSCGGVWPPEQLETCLYLKAAEVCHILLHHPV